MRTNPFASVPPGNLAHWLWRSVVRVGACVLACGGLWYGIIVRADAMCVSCGTGRLLTVITPALWLGQWLAFRQGLALFRPSSLSPVAAPVGVEIAACLWFFFQLLLHGCWGCLNFILLLCALLALADDGRGFSWG